MTKKEQVKTLEEKFYRLQAQLWEFKGDDKLDNPQYNYLLGRLVGTKEALSVMTKEWQLSEAK